MNLPGALVLGNLSSTTAVTIGRGPAIIVDNSGTGAAGTVSIAGPLSGGGAIATTSALVCGAISAGSISTGTRSVVCDAVSSSGAVNAGTRSLTSGPLASSGAVNTGTRSVGCGTLTCGSLVSAGTSSSQRWWIRMGGGTATIATNTVTDLVYTGLFAVGGSSANFPATFPTTTFTIPQSGLYLIAFMVCFVGGSSVGQRSVWMAVNSDTRRWGEISENGSSLECSIPSTLTYSFAAGDTVRFQVWQNSGVSLNGSLRAYVAAINRLFE